MRNDILLRSQYLNNIFVKPIPYLESKRNGNVGQYINTERKLKSTDVIKIKISFGSGNNDFMAFGVRRQGSATDGKHIYISCYSNYFVVACGDNINNNKHYTFSSYNDIFEIEFNPNKKYVKVNGVIDESLNDADFSLPYENGDTKYEAYLFTGNKIGTPWAGGNFRIYDYIVYDNNGSCVQHLIPTIINNIPCMYDIINNNIHYNKRKSAFIYPTQYDNILCNTIQSNGRDYMIIDYKPTWSTRLTIDYSYSSSSQSILLDASDFENIGQRYAITLAGQSSLYYGVGTITGVGHVLSDTFIDFNLSNKTFNTLNYTYSIYQTGCNPNTFIEGGFIYIFHRSDTNKISNNIKIYSVQIYENDKLLYNLQPFDDGINNGLINIIDGTKYTSVTGGRFS